MSPKSVYEGKSRPRLFKSRDFWAQDTETSTLSWMDLHKTQRSGEQSAGSRASWKMLLRKHLLGMHHGSKSSSPPSAPPPFCPTHQEMVGTSCCPLPMGTHPPGSLHHVNQDCSSATAALLGSSPHTAVGMCHEQLQTS